MQHKTYFVIICSSVLPNFDEQLQIENLLWKSRVVKIRLDLGEIDKMTDIIMSSL